MVRTLVSRGSLAYMLVSNVRKSLSVLPAFEILIWEQDVLYFLHSPRSYTLKVPLRKLSGSERHVLSLVSVIFM